MFTRLLIILAIHTVASTLAVEIVAHRGASADAPENTLPAFQLAWEQGADAVEGDFFLTADQQIVCIHDRSTARVSDRKLDVTKSRYADLNLLDVGVKKHSRWAGTRIPSLSDVLNSVPADHGRVFIEIKDGVRLVKPLAAQLAKSPLPLSRLAVIAFNEGVVKACKSALPELRVYWLVSGNTYKERGIDGIVQTAQALGADGIDVQASTALGPELGAALRSADLEFHCWTVNDLPLARHMIWLGVDSITTDRPVLIRQALAPASASGTDRGTSYSSYLNFDDRPDAAPGISGAAFENGVIKTDNPLPVTGTVALWYRPVAWYDYQTIFDNTHHPNEWELWIDKSAEIGFRTTAADLRITYRLHPVATVDQWQHIAVTWTEAEVRLYVNSALAVKAARKAPTPSQGSFCLGGGNTGNTRGHGRWDDVVVFETALSAHALRRLMLHGAESGVGQ